MRYTFILFIQYLAAWFVTEICILKFRVFSIFIKRLIAKKSCKGILINLCFRFRSPARAAPSKSVPNNRSGSGVLQPSNRDNTSHHSNQTTKRSTSEKRTNPPSRKSHHASRSSSSSCNERILQRGVESQNSQNGGSGGSGPQPLDPRMTMRLSKPTVLPPQSMGESQTQERLDARMTMRLLSYHPRILMEKTTKLKTG